MADAPLPWFRILIATPSSKSPSPSLDVLSAIGRFESHPLVVSIPQTTLNKFIEFDENVEGTKLALSAVLLPSTSAIYPLT